MPEGPEVETVRRTLTPLVVGARLGVPTVSALPLRTRITADDCFIALGPAAELTLPSKESIIDAARKLVGI